jgi:hypothetical protein
MAHLMNFSFLIFLFSYRIWFLFDFKGLTYLKSLMGSEMKFMLRVHEPLQHFSFHCVHFTVSGGHRIIHWEQK